MEALVEIQNNLNGKITRAYANFKSKGQAKMTVAYAQGRLQGLDENFKAFNYNHDKILSLKNVNKDHDYFKNKVSDLTEDAYYDNKGQFTEFLMAQEEEARAADGLNNTQLHIDPHVARSNISCTLPKIEIPKFSGKWSDWGPFRDLYKSMIHRRDDLEPVHKFYYLTAYLEGEAKNKIKNLEVKAENYATAWNNLNEYYGNKRRLISQAASSLFGIKPMKSESFSELKRLYSTTFDTVNSFEALERAIPENGEDLLVFLTVSRFDPITRKDWEKHLGSSQDPPTMDQLKNFMENQVATLESIENSNSKANNAAKSHSLIIETSESSESHTSSVKVSPKCPLCQESHYLNQCKLFKAKGVRDRKDFVTSKRLCFICFSNHSARDCRWKGKCQLCSGKHNTLLHFESSPSHPSGSATNNNDGKVGKSSNSELKSEEHVHVVGIERPRRLFVLLATALVRVYDVDGYWYLARALIDQCSQSSFVTEAFCQKLRLARSISNTCISGVAGIKAEKAKGVTRFLIRPRFNSDFSCEVEALILPKVSGYKPIESNSGGSWPHLENLTLADPHFLKAHPIDILLGARVHAQIVESQVIKGEKDNPIATKTQLGWIISGPMGIKGESDITLTHSVDNTDLEMLLEKFWNQEEFLPSAKVLSPQDQWCEDYFEKTTYQAKDGRYVVRLPLVKDKVDVLDFDLGLSYCTALDTMYSMERKFDKRPEFKAAYQDFMKEYEYLNHMKLLGAFVVEKTKGRYFLPHHGVLQGTKKLRTVFNGSAKIKQVSLNDLLYPGPNLLPELFDLILRWRLYRYVFVADIEKMFRQIWVHPDDRHFQTILWRKNASQAVSIFILLTITYGLKCSPYLAIRVLQQLAKDYGHLYPLACQIVTDESYMDDFMSGGDTIGIAREKQEQLIGLLKVGGFSLRKWAANAMELEDWLPQSHRIRDSSVFKEQNSTAILGLSWQPEKDCFIFKISIQSFDPTVLTKRMVLSQTAKIFDPMGWLAPVIVTAKIFIQSLWLLKCGWDDVLPIEYANLWYDWYKQLPSLETISIPRWLQETNEFVIVEVHGFADASSKAYGAAIYLRLVRADHVMVSLQCSKSRVAPTKTLSIPRLELCAAHLLARLVDRYLRTMKFDKYALHLWSDSKDVLFWIRATPARWQTFVANRCSQIQSLVPQAYWHHVATKENPADLVSRGKSPNLLKEADIWWSGPQFLIESSGSWSTQAVNLTISQPLEQRKVTTSLHASQGNDTDDETFLLSRFSSLLKLLRITAIWIRFLRKWSRRLSEDNRSKLQLLNLEFLQNDIESSNSISASEIASAQKLLVYIVQRRSFGPIIQQIEAKAECTNAQIAKFHPFVDKGLLRMGGRLQHSLLDYCEKFPLILPSKGPLVDLLIGDAHSKTNHGGIQLTLTTLRNGFWIIKGRASVKFILSRCVTCIRYSAKFHTQLMGNLPKERLTPAYAFEHSGVDYAGPFKIRIVKTRGNRGTMKAYVAVFICLSTRAVHLELVEDYSSEAFIAAFKRFTARRGHCSTLLSDQGTNFIGANTELKRLFDEASTEFKEKVISLANLGTTWRFNPPAAPHFGGIWEAAVKSMKHHLRRVVGEHVLTFIELSTLLCQIEACLNSRPIAPILDNPSELDVLTPSHFLIQRPSFLVPEPSISDKRISLTKRWQITTQMTQKFWSLWSGSYLRDLQQRKKWAKTSRDFRIGDIVLLRDEINPPSRWPLGIIIDLHPGSDGVVRVVKLKTEKSIYTRPIVKLVLLIPSA